VLASSGWAPNTDLVALVVAVAAGALAWRRARREPYEGWGALAAGVGAWAVGQAIWFVLEHLGDGSAVPTVADLAYFLWPVLALVGVILLGRLHLPERASGWVVMTEALLVATGTGFVLWTAVLQPALSGDERSVAAQVVLVAHPLAVAMVASTAVVGFLGTRAPALAAISLGAIVQTAAGTVAAVSDSDDGAAEIAAHMGWALGFVLVGVAALLPLHVRAVEPRRGALAREVLLSAVLIAAVATGVWRWGVQDQPLEPVSASLALLGVVLLAAHQLAQWRASSRLTAQVDEHLSRVEAAGRELRAVLDNLAEAVVVLDRDGVVVEANRPATRLSRLTRDRLVGRHFEELVPARDLERMQETWHQLMHGEVFAARPLFDLDRADGTTITVEADARPMRDASGRLVLSLRDVTDRLRTERALLDAERRFRLTFHAAPTGMCLVDPSDGRIVVANEALAKMLSSTPADLEGSPLVELVHPDDRGDGAALPAAGRRQRFVRGDGDVVWGATSVSHLPVPDAQSLVIAHVVDVSEEVRASERLAWSATHDEVTGLANRTCFLDALRKVLTQPGRPPVAVLFLDLDRFKVVNDSLGHAVGDDLLRVMASRLRDAVRHDDLVARFGGDEFTVMLYDADPAVAAEVAERIRTSLAVPILLGDDLVDVTGSIGMTLADPALLVGAEEMVRDADAAMYRAKERGRDRVETFTPETRTASLQALVGKNELRRAIEAGEVVPYFQPIVELANGRLSGYEAVARWLHPEKGLLTPNQFLPAAEEHGLMGLLGAQVLRSALTQLAHWQTAGALVGPLSMSVNVSARQLVDSTFVDVVAGALAESGVPADALWLELTESALMADVRSATSALRALRGLGLHLAVDDFGTGYSSLTYLKRFPVEAIKIDRAFVAGLGLDADDSAIVEAVVRLGGSLGLRVIAEGVETPLQLARLRELECGWAQGYLFGRPRPAELLEPFHQV
jgi:diguanylate cyclase (GGDEF)-like protein/PAS domain S-box-containing protein